MKALRILIADDSAVYRGIIKRCLREVRDIEVVGMAGDGGETLRQVEALDPDLLLLDVNMPVMNGPEVLAELRKRGREVGAIVISGMDDGTLTSALEAVSRHAFEVIAKPQMRSDSGADALAVPLREAIEAYRVSLGGTYVASAPLRAAATPTPSPRPARRATAGAFDLVVIGISTGGPAALGQLVPALSAGFPLPILIVQHMPAGFTGHLTQVLSRTAKLPIHEAREGDEVAPGRILMAPGDQHMTLCGGRMSTRVTLDQGPLVNNCRPAADRLFQSAAEVFGARTLGVVMTGMGQDGLEGARAIRRAGGSILCQDQTSCAVYGMPRAVIEAGEADEVLPLEKLADRIQMLAGKGGARWAS